MLRLARIGTGRRSCLAVAMITCVYEQTDAARPRSVHLVFEYCDNDLACMLEAMSRPFLESEVSGATPLTDH